MQKLLMQGGVLPNVPSCTSVEDHFTLASSQSSISIFKAVNGFVDQLMRN